MKKKIKTLSTHTSHPNPQTVISPHTRVTLIKSLTSHTLHSQQPTTITTHATSPFSRTHSLITSKPSLNNLRLSLRPSSAPQTTTISHRTSSSSRNLPPTATPPFFTNIEPPQKPCIPPRETLNNHRFTPAKHHPKPRRSLLTLHFHASATNQLLRRRFPFSPSNNHPHDKLPPPSTFAPLPPSTTVANETATLEHKILSVPKSQPQINNSPLQHQPPVYNINENEFRDV
ncbi:uncharacterized protein LOC127122232 [Lathyrus oleraceus]|uniref:uncharacterized protein LOC127122232 n=1 Tax=Pisum sativum TaxID=3888 RepID=UPI0021CFE59B|nr:uncharacterized protein LOC127122232 [Pisum sativum]